MLIIHPCDKHKDKGASKKEQEKCKDCKKEYVSFI